MFRLALFDRIDRIDRERDVARLKHWRLICHLVTVIWMANTAGFVATTFPNGSAVGGKIEGGRFYAYGKARPGESRYREVNEAIFKLNLGFFLLHFATVPALLIASLAQQRIQCKSS